MSNEQQQDPRFYLAAERTFLAWIRTGLSMMGFGFVVARFGLFLREVHFEQHHGPAPPTGYSLVFGTALVAIGVIVNAVAIVEHLRVTRNIRESRPINRPSKFAIAIATLMALVGLTMCIYLISV